MYIEAVYMVRLVFAVGRLLGNWRQISKEDEARLTVPWAA